MEQQLTFKELQVGEVFKMSRYRLATITYRKTDLFQAHRLVKDELTGTSNTVWADTVVYPIA